MHVGRKEALFALIAGVVPWVSRRALAEATPMVPAPAPAQLQPTQAQAAQIGDLQKRVAALEALLANQVAFTKDASGNLTLNAPANVTLSGTSLSLKGTVQAILSGQGIVKVTGANIYLN